MASLNPTPTPAGVDVQVNTYTDSVQQQPAVTALSDGGFVVTWQSADEDGSSWGIYARRYDYGGEGLGEHFRVNTSTAGDQSPASVTALSDGGFVVAWSSADAQVYGQRFGSDGVAVGGEFRINSSVTGSHTSVAVSGFADGGFLSAWAANGQGGDLYEIYGQRYKADGAAIGSEFRINSYTQSNQIQPALATMADGGFVVTWSSIGQDGSGFGIYGQRFTSDGAPVGTEFRVNTRTVGNQAYSSPAALLDGGFVVTWTSLGQDGSKEGIYGQRYGANGAAIGAEFRINTYTNDTQVFSSVTALRDGGFVVTWSSNGQDGSGYGIFGQRFTADARPAGGEFRVNGTTAGDQVAEILSGSETLATLASGRLVQVWSGLVGPEEVFFRLIDVPTPAFTSAMTGSIGENAPPPVVAYDADVTADGPITYSLSGADSRFFVLDRNGQVTFLVPPNFEAPADKGADNVYDIVVHASDGSYEISRAVAITVTDESAASMTPVPLASDVQVNSYTAGDQSEAAVTSLSDGGFVVTWTSSGQDGSVAGVYGQRYAEDGTAIGYEFKVNTYTTSDQFRSSVTSLSDGGFVVTWTSRGQDGSGYGVYGQRYTENGLWVGGEFKVNTYTKGEQSYSTVGALPDGGFVVTWMSPGQDGPLSHIYGQRYAQNGMPAGNEFRVTTSEGSHGEPAITSLSDGGFLVTWTAADSHRSGVFGQRYAADGTAQGGEFRINSYTTNIQSNSFATSLLDGGFVVTWSSLDQDHGGYGYGIYGQRYAQNGSPVGSEFKVNTEIGGDQRYSSVTSLPDGGFVVTWTSSGQDGSGYGVYGQRYAADGTSLGGEFRLNQITAGDQGNDSYYGAEHLTSLNDGHFVQVWSGTGEVFFRLVKVPWGDDNTAPSITSDGGQGTASLSVAENTKVVTTVVGHDTDYGQTLSYSLAGGADAAAFAIDGASGAMSFVAAPDFEAPADANKDNVYEVVVKVSDGAGGSDSQAIGVTVTNVDAALTITSGAAGTVAENAPATTVVYGAAAKDSGENSGRRTYSLASGGDSKLFDIDAGTGQVTFKAPADFEKPGDADGNNVYQITVQASDGSLAASQAVSIKVTDQNDNAPVITTEAALSAAENTKPIVVLTSTDPDTVGGNSPLFPFYSISGGPDGALFEIIDGSLEFAPGRDYEREAHSYQVEVTVSDGVNETTKLLTIAVTDQNDTAPEITTEQDLSVAENTLIVAALTSTDADTVGPTPAEFSVSGGPDADLFDVADGNLVFKKAPDFETGPERYLVEVTASDGVNKTTKVLAVWLTDQNDNAPVITTEAALSVVENTLVVAALTSTDKDTVGTAPAEFSVSGGPDAGLFDVAGGNLVFKKAPDFETDPHSYQVEVTASDGVNHSAKLLTVTLTDLLADNNTAPTITSGATGTVAENAPAATVVYDAEAKDDGGTLTYSLAADGDSKLFDIDVGTGQVTFKAPADFEKPGDADGNNVYQITVQASDGSLAASQAVSITVTDQNDVAPVITTEAALSVAENTLVVAPLTSSDVDTVGPAPAKFSVRGGADAALFDVAGGNLVFRKAPDFETDPHSYQVEVTASDGVAYSAKLLTITLTDQNDVAPTITTEAAWPVMENTLIAAALASIDVDTVGAAPVFTVSGGADAGLFGITGSNVVFKKAPDFETDPHSYQVEVTASDGVNHSAKLLTITLVDQNDTAPMITTEAALSVVENALVVAALSSIDADTVGIAPAEFSITGGADAALFDVAGGNLVFKKAPDFETDPHSYQVEVTASDGVNHSAKLLTVTLTDLLGDNNASPSITSDGGQGTASLSIAENTKVVTTVVGHDTDYGQTLTYSLAGGADAAAFAIDGASGTLSFVVAPDFEAPGDTNKDNVYEVVVKVSDGAGGSDSQAIGVTVTDVNAAPTITSGATGTVAENASVATVVYDAAGKDDGEDRGTLTYSLAAGGDSKLFSIDVGTGQVTFKAPADFEKPGDAGGNNVYEITVQANDGSLAASQAVSITVTDQNDVAPVITTEAALSVAENTPVVAALTSTDVDTVGTAPAVFSISGGPDAGLFDVTAGNLVFKKAPDFETDPHSYQVEVTASDGVNHNAKLLTVTLTDLLADNNTAPTITSGATGTVAENAPATTVVYDAEAKDDGGTLTYSLAAGGDSKLFNIDVGTGQVTFKASADFEKPGDADGNNVYQITVQASDGSLAASQAVAITVTDQNDGAGVGGPSDHLGALKDVYIVLQGTSQLSVDARSGVLFNDQQMSAGTAGLATGPGHGSIELNGDGSFVYSLSDGFAGMDSFSYKATSTLGALDSAEALVYVVPVIAGPTITTLDLFSLSREEQLAATYVSFLGRGADRDGFDFWMKQYVAHETTANPGDILAGISSSFATSEEAKGIYSFLANPHGASDAQIVSFLDSVYLNLFNRTTDEAGRAYWSDEIKETLAAGGSVGSVLMNIVGGAQNTAAGLDITTLMSKVAVNLEYIHAQQEVGNAWTFADDQAQAVDLLKPVASDPQSVLIGVVNAHNIVAADIF